MYLKYKVNLKGKINYTTQGKLLQKGSQAQSHHFQVWSSPAQQKTIIWQFFYNFLVTLCLHKKRSKEDQPQAHHCTAPQAAWIWCASFGQGSLPVLPSVRGEVPRDENRRADGVGAVAAPRARTAPRTACSLYCRQPAPPCPGELRAEQTPQEQRHPCALPAARAAALPQRGHSDGAFCEPAAERQTPHPAGSRRLSPSSPPGHFRTDALGKRVPFRPRLPARGARNWPLRRRPARGGGSAPRAETPSPCASPSCRPPARPPRCRPRSPSGAPFPPARGPPRAGGPAAGAARSARERAGRGAGGRERGAGAGGPRRTRQEEERSGPARAGAGSRAPLPRAACPRADWPAARPGLLGGPRLIGRIVKRWLRAPGGSGRAPRPAPARSRRRGEGAEPPAPAAGAAAPSPPLRFAPRERGPELPRSQRVPPGTGALPRGGSGSS